MLPPKSVVSAHGTFGDYEVWGWLNLSTAAWHVEVWPCGNPLSTRGYIVTDGTFSPDTASVGEITAMLSLIGKWQSQFPMESGEGDSG
jgi:hypothetical protein